MKKAHDIFFLFIILCSYSLTAQTWEDYNKEFLESFDAADTVNSLEYAIKGYMKAEQDFGKEHQNFVIASNNLGLAYEFNSRKDLAEQYFKQAIEIAKKIHFDDNPDYIIFLENLALLYFNQQRNEELESIWLEYARANKSISGEDSPEYAKSLNYLAALYDRTGQPEKAEPLYIQAIKIGKETLLKGTPAIAQWFENLGYLYQNQSRFDDASDLLNQSLVIRRIKCKEDPDAYFSLLDNLSGLYLQLNMIEKSEILYNEYLDAIIEVNGEESKSYYECIIKIADFYYKNDLFVYAAKYYLKVIELDKKIRWENDLTYATHLTYLASAYENAGQFDKAVKLFQQAMAIRKSVSGKSSDSYTSTLGLLASCYEGMMQFKKAETIYKDIAAIHKKLLSSKSPDYIGDLNDLGRVNFLKDDFSEAQNILVKAYDLCLEMNAQNEPYYSLTLHNLGACCNELGNYRKAETFFLEAISIREKDTNNKEKYASSMNFLAEVYLESGQYEKSEELYLKVLKINKDVYGENDPKYAETLNDLSRLYKNTGQWEKVEPLLLKYAELIKNQFGEEHSNYGVAMNGLAEYYWLLNQNDKTEQLLLKSLKIEQKNPSSKLNFSIRVLNLATLYQDLGYFHKADSLYIIGVKIIEDIYGKKHPKYATVINNMAELYKTMQQFKKAEKYYILSLEIRKKVLGEHHRDYASSLNNLGGLYQEMRQYSKAEKLLSEAYKICNRPFGNNDRMYNTISSNLGNFYWETGKFQKAKDLHTNGLQIIKNEVQTTFRYLSETEKNNFISEMEYTFQGYLSFFYEQHTTDTSLAGYAYNLELIRKGIVLKSGSELRRTIISSGDSSLIAIFDHLSSIYKEIISLNSSSNARLDENLMHKTKEAEEYEKELSRKSQVFSDLKNEQLYDWQYIRASLKENEAAIEFTSFQFLNINRLTDSIFYCAIIIKPGNHHPEIIPLFEEQKLDSLFIMAYGNDIFTTEQLYSTRGTIVTGANQSINLAPKLFDLLWKPIEPSLKDIKTIYFSPAGLLHKISFSAIVTPEHLYLSDKYHLIQLGSTREVVSLKRKMDYLTLSDSAIVFGGINFDHEAKKKRKSEGDELLAYNWGPLMQTERSSSTEWHYLPGTFREAKYIDSLFKKNQVSTAFYCDSNATETLFKNLSGVAPQIIHISTHGFFFPEPKKKKDGNAFVGTGEERFRFSENPLLRSGLILAGANIVWKGGELESGKNDGILTAYEVSNMNLYNTKLVVMSACETGLGEIKGSEGVFGLQRAFKMAGVDYIIMSLWQVPDKETVEFMQLFYINCFKKQTICDAFNHAQSEMRKKYDPYYWAAFVLVR